MASRSRTRNRLSRPLGLAVSLSIVAALAAPAHAAFPGQNGKIAFTSDRDGNYEIYSMNPDGTGQTNRTNNTSADYDPAWSPDGAKIAFTSNRDVLYEIYTMNADGTGQTRRTNNVADDFGAAWSPDGTKIAFYSNRDGNFEIYTMNADGTGQTRRTNNAAADGEPAWSPDGTMIAFTSNRDSDDGNHEIYTMNADGTGQTRRTNNFATDLSPDWSPDGAKIAFTSVRDSNWEIYTMNADGTGQTNRTNSAALDSQPAWSPDGTKIAFTSGDEIYSMNADGTGQTNRTNNAAFDFDPDWQPLVHDAPTESSPITVSLVPAFRQTISATQCSARGGQNSTHGSPLALPSCNPPGYLPNTIAKLGSQSSASAMLTAIPGDALTAPDEADLAVVVNASDVRNRVGGSDYDPSASADATLDLLIRLSDTNNGTGATPATTSDFHHLVPIDCTAIADPALGATCAATTTVDSITPGAIEEGKRSVMTTSRFWLFDSGINAIRGDGDDRQFAQSGIYIP